MVEDYGGHGGGMMIQFGSAMVVLWVGSHRPARTMRPVVQGWHGHDLSFF